jgi:hypothetical protein
MILSVHQARQDPVARPVVDDELLVGSVAQDVGEDVEVRGKVACLVVLSLPALSDRAGAALNLERALELFRELGDRHFQAWALNHLGAVAQLSGDYAGASANHMQALELFRDLGAQLGEPRP